MEKFNLIEELKKESLETVFRAIVGLTIGVTAGIGVQKYAESYADKQLLMNRKQRFEELKEAKERSLQLQKLDLSTKAVDESLLEIYDYVGASIVVNNFNCIEVGMLDENNNYEYGIVNLDFRAEILPCSYSAFESYYTDEENNVYGKLSESHVTTILDDGSVIYHQGYINLTDLNCVIPVISYETARSYYDNEYTYVIDSSNLNDYEGLSLRLTPYK